MRSLLIAQLEIFNKKKFLEYVRLVPKTIQDFDGKIIVRGDSILPVEGNWNPQKIVIIEFVSVERAKEWWNSQEYSNIKQIREASAETKMIILQGTSG